MIEILCLNYQLLMFLTIFSKIFNATLLFPIFQLFFKLSNFEVFSSSRIYNLTFFSNFSNFLLNFQILTTFISEIYKLTFIFENVQVFPLRFHVSGLSFQTYETNLKSYFSFFISKLFSIFRFSYELLIYSDLCTCFILKNDNRNNFFW